MLSKEIQRIQATGARRSANVIEANVVALGATPGRYQIKLRDGTVINDVLGAEGLLVGQSVTVAVHSGKVGKYTILGGGYANTADIKEVWV